jgi:pimeloyl-ACP methyl ester carboxylesterase
MADELHDLLEAAGVPGPYLPLVGHSIGGIIGRQFASRYPGDVCGLVRIDSSHEGQLRRPGLANWPHSPAGFYWRAARRQARVLGARRLLASIGASPRLKAEIAREVPAEHAGAARAITLSTIQRRTAVREILMMATLTGRPPHLGSLPLVVLTAGRQPAGWFQLQDELAGLSSRTTHVVVGNAGHYVHLDDPEVVIQVIRELAGRVLAE